jgi:hypothetical protein
MRFFLSSKCGERAYSFATAVANEKILLDIADIDRLWMQKEERKKERERVRKK